jgi:hypothetical protein
VVAVDQAYLDLDDVTCRDIVIPGPVLERGDPFGHRQGQEHAGIAYIGGPAQPPQRDCILIPPDSLRLLSGTHRLGPARYSHITAEMRWRLLEGLTDLWDAAFDQRMNYSVGSPVGVLDALLRERWSLGEF